MEQRRYSTIDAYIRACPRDVQGRLREVRQAIHEAAPDARQAISYQMPTFKMHGNLVHFAAFKNHIGLYPAGDGLESLTKQIAPYRTGKGTLQFPHERPLPVALIKRIVKLRVKADADRAKKAPARQRRGR